MIYNTLRLQGPIVRGHFFRTLRACDPDAARRIERLYQGRTAPGEEYRRRLAETIGMLRERYGLLNGERFVRQQEAQLSLFAAGAGEKGGQCVQTGPAPGAPGGRRASLSA